MSKHKESPIDQAIAAEVTTARKIRILMETRENSLGRWAINRGYFPEQVKQCLTGARPYPEIREAIAEWLVVDQTVVDAAIDEVVATVAA